jgi:hypothetical protein
MGTDTPNPTQSQDKQVTVPVPEDRVPEFYAFYAQFLAGGTRRRGGRRGPHRGPGPHRHGHGHGCHPHHEDAVERHAEQAPAAPGPDAPPAA